MTATNEPQPPRVSDEDRAAAVTILERLVRGAGYEVPSLDVAHAVVDALVSHGWGPRARVSTTDVAKIIAHILVKFSETGDIGEGYAELDSYLRERGIEIERKLRGGLVAGGVFIVAGLTLATCWTVYAFQVEDWRFAAIAWIPILAGWINRAVRGGD